MPNAPKKINRPWKLQRKPFGRAVDNSAFYNSWKWRKKRKAYLQEHPLCIECEKLGIVTAATVVDHIVQITQGGCKLCDDNLQGLCNHHHNAKSARESHKKRKK